PVEDPRGPAFLCRFVHNGQEVYRVRFGELDRWEGPWEQALKVKRRWKEPLWPASELLTRPAENWDSWRVRAVGVVDLNGNGRLDPEEAAAFRAATGWRAEKAFIAQLYGVEEDEEMEFPVVQKTAIVRP